MEVYETESKTQTSLNTSVNSASLVNNINPSSENSNQEKKPRTRRKRGSKKKKEGSKYNDRNFIKKGVDMGPTSHPLLLSCGNNLNVCFRNWSWHV